jgi:hypothetical protein
VIRSLIRRIIRAVVGGKGRYRKPVYAAIVVQTSLYSTERHSEGNFSMRPKKPPAVIEV